MTAPEETRRRRIAICTPVGRQVEADFTRSLLATYAALSKSAEIMWLTVVGHANLPRARNVLVGQALAAGVDDIVFIDSDIGWDVDAFEALFKVPQSVGIVAGCPQRRSEGDVAFCGSADRAPNKIDLADGRYLLTGYAATAFLRVNRRVFDTLAVLVDAFDYDDFEYRAFFNYKIGQNPFNGKRGFIGEDYYFSMLARDTGISVWLDPAIELRHWHSKELQANMAEHIKVKEPDDG